MPCCYLVFLLLGGAKEELLCLGASDQKTRLLWIPDIFLEQSIPLIMHYSLQTSLLE